MTRSGFSLARLSLTGFVVVLILAWVCYRPALSGAFQLDDAANLAGLAAVEDLQTASDFVLAGSNGPLGRPIAMASFALQADDFADGAGAFLEVNLLLHLLNAVLLAWCLFQLSAGQQVERQRAVLVAVVAASVWLLLPLLATASLLVVQRMTTLSTLFMLAGLGGYLALRGKVTSRPRDRLIAMTAVLAVATLLAAFTKESGLLLPMLVLVIEATILAAPAGVEPRHWRRFKLAVLALPAAAIVLYLVSRYSYPDWMQARRGFDGWQRLLTESQVLWLYVRKAVLGIPGQLGIFQSDFPVARSLLEFRALAAAVGWLALAVAAVVWRRRRPLFAFAVLWFLAGHVLESTVLPLEIYFEHRNYLPVVGPIFALCVYLLGRPGLRAKAGLSALSLFVLVNAYFLYVFASLWGEPSLASRYWAQRYPDSVRAVTGLATYQLLEEGPQRTVQTIRRFTAEHPEHAYLRIQALNISCLYGTETDLTRAVDALEDGLAEVVFTYSAGTMLSQLFSTSVRADCKGLDTPSVLRLATALQQNARYVNDPYYSQFHYKLLAGIARYRGDNAAALDHLRTAIAYWPTSELNMMMVTALAGAGDFDGADAFINDAMLDSPANPLKAIAWRRDLEGLRAYIRELEKHLSQDQAADEAHDTETGTE